MAYSTHCHIYTYIHTDRPVNKQTDNPPRWVFDAMPLLKRKPVLYHALPSLATVVQPVSHGSKETETTPPPAPPPPTKGKKSKDQSQEPVLAEGSTSAWVPPDADNDEQQLKLLSRVFDEATSAGRSKKAGTWILNGSLDGIKDEQGQAQNGESSNSHAHTHTNGNSNGSAHGEMLPPPIPSSESWKVTDREVFYIPETGEIFTDYEYVHPLSLSLLLETSS